ncbi:RagB/SusD family nutrient uptake outer membrane protein [Rhodocytophaga rosea]|uniref:RagB/SusD family nutrient uptake outer membrane protein n=1 Tax=Rhodocytophaga rosea TaxID=2704465 RepID=A0A6C0GR40_9BACT|nr:RagB/SusD family nutrient uptake outer membrane protein [Rhodocytophaga rosea]QHT69970.1 RagB/SusD family nutrient uptake outer membrane protein [Rhodocytophaga rosea]
MKRTTIHTYILILSGILFSCKDQLDIQNPNQPGLASAQTESGLISLAQGGVYVNGFKELKYYDGVPGYFWSGAIGFHELMGDVIGEEAANQFGNQIGAPEYLLLDNGTRVGNPNSPAQQIALIRQANVNANAGQNTIFYEWAYMYGMNNAMNTVLNSIEQASFSGDAETKKNTVKAWAYFWKGFAYSRIGSIYYAGLINNESNKTNGNYVTKEQIIAEATANFDNAATILGAISNQADYQATLGKLIPDFNQVGKGGILAPDMWVRNINTMKARNILVNTTVKTMTAAQWNEILTLAGNGITATDLVFTGRSNENGDFLSANAGTVAAKATNNPGSGITYKISERLIQDFKPGDKRLENNFLQLASPWRGESSRGNSFNTRWQLLDGGNGLPGVVVLSNRTPGEYELILAGNYEENALMLAEAKIYSNDIEGGLQLIDEVRTYQGAGLTPVAGTGLSLEAAKEELRRERRVTLPFRGLSFYDARRWGVIDDISQGGGRTNAIVISQTGQLNTNATINYNFLDYWDVPDNELVYNPAQPGSAPTRNPK